jgi:hypothetical protein
VIPLALPQEMVSYKEVLSIQLFVVRDREIARMLILSAYLNLVLGVPIQKRGAI